MVRKIWTDTSSRRSIHWHPKRCTDPADLKARNSSRHIHIKRVSQHEKDNQKDLQDVAWGTDEPASQARVKTRSPCPLTSKVPQNLSIAKQKPGSIRHHVHLSRHKKHEQ
jgi:hypothetical protein